MKPTSSVEEWYDKVYQANACDNAWLSNRFSACRALKEGGIPCYIWSEDALSYYGVPTGCFDIRVLVSDQKEAAELLIAKGWLRPPSNFPARYNDIEELTSYLLEPRLADCHHPNGEIAHTVVALLTASDWNITLPDFPSNKSCPYGYRRRPFIPLLHDVLDSLIETWLDSPDRCPHFRMQLAVFLAYLYRYVPILKSPEFAQYLRIEHRQYHYDVISGVEAFGDEFRIHEKQVRDLLRAGKRQLLPKTKRVDSF